MKFSNARYEILNCGLRRKFASVVKYNKADGAHGYKTCSDLEEALVFQSDPAAACGDSPGDAAGEAQDAGGEA